MITLVATAAVLLTSSAETPAISQYELAHAIAPLKQIFQERLLDYQHTQFERVSARKWANKGLVDIFLCGRINIANYDGKPSVWLRFGAVSERADAAVSTFSTTGFALEPIGDDELKSRSDAGLAAMATSAMTAKRLRNEIDKGVYDGEKPDNAAASSDQALYVSTGAEACVEPGGQDVTSEFTR